MIAEGGREAPGWYGKLPSLGDFASRRLPGEFIRPWDEWLQVCLEASRRAMGPGWLDCYLTMPIWRFVLLAGVVGPSGWAGVLMPSVDGVGRQFPLTLASALPSYAAAAHAVFDGAHWFASLEDVALSTLDVSVSPEELDRALAGHAFAAPVEVPGPGGTMRRLPAVEGVESLARAEALRAWGQHGGWSGLWWTRGRIGGDALMLTSVGLPTGEEFGWMLAGPSTPGPISAG